MNILYIRMGCHALPCAVNRCYLFVSDGPRQKAVWSHFKIAVLDRGLWYTQMCGLHRIFSRTCGLHHQNVVSLYMQSLYPHIHGA